MKRISTRINQSLISADNNEDDDDVALDEDDLHSAVSYIKMVSNRDAPVTSGHDDDCIVALILLVVQMAARYVDMLPRMTRMIGHKLEGG